MEDEAMLAQVEAEIHAMNGGINPQEAPTQEESVPTTDENENEENENKTEKKIKKLLSQRNEEKKEKESLAQRLAEIENKLADTEFYKDNQAALEYKQDIDSLVNERGFTRDEAYLLVAGKKVLEQSKKLSANKTSMIGQTPGINRTGTNPANMPMSDLDNLVKEMYVSGKLTI